jgi:hypothetical protein
MSQIAVLVGFAEAIAAPEVVWSLVDGGYNVIAFGRKGRPSALRHSRYVTVHEVCPPEVDAQAAQADFRSLIESMDAKGDGSQRVLFPLDDTALWLCSTAALPRQWILAGPRGASAQFALDKYLQAQKAAVAGLAVPAPTLARTARDVLNQWDAASGPLILKSAECAPIYRNSVCKCRTWVCANRPEVERAVAQWAERVPLLVQPFIVGTGEGVFGLAAPDGIRAWSAHKRVRMMNPQGSGSSACVSQPVPQDLRPKIVKFLQMGAWRGLFMIELLRDRSGKSWFIELNGRPWGSMALSRRQGLEYPAWHVSLAIDDRSQAGTVAPSQDGIVCRNAGREIMHLLFVLRGPKSKALNNWPSFWKTIREVVRVRPEDKFCNWRREDPKVFIADSYRTIHSNLFKARS